MLDKAGGVFSFEVALNTHSVDLDYDLTELSWLQVGEETPIRAGSWSGARGGHHLSGVLEFPSVDLKGEERLEIRIRSVGGAAERVFRWDLPSSG